MFSMNEEEQMPERNLKPIRKLAVAGGAAALIYVASLAGLELGDEDAQEAAQVLVPLVLAYFVKDPRVTA